MIDNLESVPEHLRDKLVKDCDVEFGKEAKLHVEYVENRSARIDGPSTTSFRYLAAVHLAPITSK